jgi:hypothetical protein
MNYERARYFPAGLEVGKTNIQLNASVENQDRAKRGKNEASEMIPFVCRARKHVGNDTADDQTSLCSFPDHSSRFESLAQMSFQSF